jgi:hypothetical protein
MLFQLCGWPSWINALATHGLTGPHIGVGLQPTILIDAAKLKAIYWQTRPAGVFSSNQMNTLFFFVVFAFAISSSRPYARFLLPVAAVYAVTTLAKSAIFGSALFCILLATLYRGEYVQRAFSYVFWLVLALVIYHLIFPGVLETYLAPYVIMMSLLADSLGLSAAIERIVQYSSQTGTFSQVVADTITAFETSTPGGTAKVVDYSSVGNLTLYSEMARTPILSTVIVVGIVAVAVVLNLKKSDWWRFSSVQAALSFGLFVYTIVSPVAAMQSFWLLVGMALPRIYGDLVRIGDCNEVSGKPATVQKR